MADETADQVQEWVKDEHQRMKGASSDQGQLIKVKGLDKQQLCIDLLMVGCVQSFVDFYYITHRKSAPGANDADFGGEQDVDIPEETLLFFKETLESAESARSVGSYQQCFEAYNTLAEYFERVSDLKSAMYFFKRCAEVATEVQAHESIAKANLSLGSCEERAGNWHSAMSFHEKALQIATAADSLPLQIKAASRLTKVYQVLAELCEKDNRDSEATSLYERCLHCARLSKDDMLEGAACHKLGLSKHRMGKFSEALDLQKRYLDICITSDDRVGESAARAALAHAHEAIGDTQDAIKQLENLLSVASEAGELKAQASACLNLGILYNGRGDHEKSVELLEQHFDLARQIGDRRLIDSARVVLGMVRGNGKLKSYIDLVNNDLDKLLKWKSKRAALDS
jgi:tetratricopeptide (TPR) repeat protein